MKNPVFYLIVFLFLGLGISTSSAQSSWFKFGISEPGIYKITKAEAQKRGFSDLSEVAIFGYPGMLPQKLDSIDLSLKEIPSLQTEEALYFFLEGPNTIHFNENGGITYLHHSYTDTLSYLAGKSSAPKRIQSKPGLNQTPSGNQAWYTFKSLKEEKTNLLNSGRSWYSNPIRQGQSLAVNFGASTDSNLPWLIKAKVMSQSTGVSQVRLFSGNDQLAELTFDPIPNSTYGLKGREKFFEMEWLPENKRVNQLRFGFQGTGSGFLDFVVLGIPSTGNNPSDGIYFGKNSDFFELAAGKQVWEISDFYNPVYFSTGQSALGKKWLVFSQSSVKSIESFTPLSKKPVAQNNPELLVLTIPQFSQVADRLKTHKEGLGIQSAIVFTSEIFDWFGYGNRDLTAIRNFIASVYHQKKAVKNVLILGKGTFDYKNKLGGRPNLIPIYASESSLDPLTTYSSDDYMAFLDWGQGEWSETMEGDELMKIGIGRIPAINFREANDWVEKIIQYESMEIENQPSPTLAFFSDDGDNAIHMRDAEVHAGYLNEKFPYFRTEKLYLDQFEQQKSGNLQRSPEMKKSLNETLDRGTLLLNYIGHGNETTLTAEEVFQIQDIENWKPQSLLPVWVTATCEFGRHDSPFLRSGAEELLFAKSKGAIGLLTTGRPVFSSVNFSLNQAFIREVLESEDGLTQNLGSIFRKTKNLSLNGPFNRNFSLLGDPSLKLAVPELEIHVREILDLNSKKPVDSIFSFGRFELIAEISDPVTGALIPNFNGKYQIEFWDQPLKKKTRGDENPVFDYQVEANMLFKGEGEVKNGELVAKFVVPELSTPATERLSLRLSAMDIEKKLLAGGIVKAEINGQASSLAEDKEGPKIELKTTEGTQNMGAIPSRELEITLDFTDESGINISSKDPEKILRIVVNETSSIQLNKNYRALKGDFTEGQVKILVTGLVEGVNQLEVFAWDNAGNMGKLEFTIEVKGSNRLRILELQLFPNPSTEYVFLNFSHNRPGENLQATLNVYSTDGQILFSEERRLVRAEKNIQGWNLIFFVSKTKYPAKGTYLYNLSLKSESDFDSDSKSGKLLIQ